MKGGKVYQHHGLKNSKKVVYEEICRLLAEGQSVSYTALSDATGYCQQTIANAVRELRNGGYIGLQRTDDGWTYTVKHEEEIMIGIIKSMWNIITMSSGERWERMLMAIAAKRIYEDAQKLKRAARHAGDGWQERVDDLLSETGADRLSAVWPLDEAAHIQARLDALLDEVKK
jgi:biotin operon repressor